MNKDGFVSSIKESEINEGQMRAVRVKGKPSCRLTDAKSKTEKYTQKLKTRIG